VNGKKKRLTLYLKQNSINMTDNELFAKAFTLFVKNITETKHKSVSLGEHLDGTVDPNNDRGLLFEICKFDVTSDELIKLFSDSIKSGEMSNNDFCITLGLYISAIKVKLAHPWTSKKAKCFFNYQLSKYENIKTLFEGAKNIEKDNVKNVITGFKSKLSDQQIDNLFKQLHEADYINTDINTFKAIFKDEPLPPGFIPIKRTKKLKVNSLAFLIRDLFMTENQNDFWKIAEKCFDKVTDNSLKNSYSITFKNTKKNKPIGYDKIETILKNIYTPLQ
jgi:hypothetical protein